MIVAVLSRSGPPEVGQVTRMLAAAPHRGPALATRAHGRCVLGIGGRSDRGDTSLSRPGSLNAAFTGRLDNADALTADLTRHGCPPASPDPADVVVSAFQAFGSDSPNRMRGTFAAVVTDGQRLWCFRDHLGFRPLFYRDDPRTFLVATEVKQIVAGARLPREPNLEVLEQMFYGRMVEDGACALRGASRLPPARTLAVNGAGTAAVTRYWRREHLVDSLRLSEIDARDRLCQLLDQAVARCLVGDDVVSLSGGIDSSAVAAFAGPRCAALSAVYPDYPTVDERSYIELTTRRFGIALHTYVQQARVLDDADAWTSALDGPTLMGSVPELYENYALAHRLGFRNVLTGELTEFVVGSPRYVLGHLLTRWRWIAFARVVAAERRRGRAWSTLARQVLSQLAIRGHQPPTAASAPDWLDPNQITANADSSVLSLPARRRWPAEQLRAFGGATIALDADEACAARTGVTVRRPFADVDVWEFFLALTAETKFPDLGLKTLVKHSLRGRVPDEILNRPSKTVFDAHFMSQIDYAALRQLLVDPPGHRVLGVHYARLAQRLERQDFSMVDWFWAKDLAMVHAFLRQW